MPMRVNDPLPALTGAIDWLNGQVRQEDLAGQPVLIHFWSVSCHICKETMPGVVAWRDQYEPDGLKMIGVHVPRQDSDADAEAVKQVVAQFGMKHPVALDHELALNSAFQNEYVPAFYVFDREGRLRFRAGGDKGFGMVEGRIRRVCGLEQ